MVGKQWPSLLQGKWDLVTWQRCLGLGGSPSVLPCTFLSSTFHTSIPLSCQLQLLPLLAFLPPPKPVPVIASVNCPEVCPGLGDFLQVLRRLRASLTKVSPPHCQGDQTLAWQLCVTHQISVFSWPQRSLSRHISRCSSPWGNKLIVTRIQLKESPVLDRKCQQ